MLTALMVSLAIQSAEPFKLNLLCEGSGTQAKALATYGRVRGSDGQWANGTVTTTRDRDFTDAVRVEIAGETGRIRLPQPMLPLIRGGHNGWMNLKKIEVSPDEITAQATINLFNTAKIRIDRVTGTLSLGAKLGQFSGACKAYDPEKVERAF